MAPELGCHFFLVIETLRGIAKIASGGQVGLVIWLVVGQANAAVEVDLFEAGQRRKEQL